MPRPILLVHAPSLDSTRQHLTTTVHSSPHSLPHAAFLPTRRFAIDPALDTTLHSSQRRPQFVRPKGVGRSRPASQRGAVIISLDQDRCLPPAYESFAVAARRAKSAQAIREHNQRNSAAIQPDVVIDLAIPAPLTNCRSRRLQLADLGDFEPSATHTSADAHAPNDVARAHTQSRWHPPRTRPARRPQLRCPQLRRRRISAISSLGGKASSLPPGTKNLRVCPHSPSRPIPRRSSAASFSASFLALVPMVGTWTGSRCEGAVSHGSVCPRQLSQPNPEWRDGRRIWSLSSHVGLLGSFCVFVSVSNAHQLTRHQWRSSRKASSAYPYDRA